MVKITSLIAAVLLATAVSASNPIAAIGHVFGLKVRGDSLVRRVPIHQFDVCKKGKDGKPIGVKIAGPTSTSAELTNMSDECIAAIDTHKAAPATGAKPAGKDVWHVKETRLGPNSFRVDNCPPEFMALLRSFAAKA